MVSTRKEIEKKMLIKKTISSMNNQIQKLEEQKKVYIEAGKQAKQRGLDAQYKLALSGLKMTMAQQKRVYEMKLNFEITSQMKDMSAMTGEFLKCMGSLSKDMVKMTNQKEFANVQKQFEEAMIGVDIQTEQLENFMDETQSSFETNTRSNEADNAELEKLMLDEATTDEISESMLDKEMEELKKKMNS